MRVRLGLGVAGQSSPTLGVALGDRDTGRLQEPRVRVARGVENLVAVPDTPSP